MRKIWFHHDHRRQYGDVSTGCFVCNELTLLKKVICVFDIRILDEREEPGFLTGLKIPAPWAAGKTVETVHPVRDNYKFKETVHIPGARCLYLRFDSRCSSQYDYDKVPSPLTLAYNLCHLSSIAKLWLEIFFIKYLLWYFSWSSTLVPTPTAVK